MHTKGIAVDYEETYVAKTSAREYTHEISLSKQDQRCTARTKLTMRNPRGLHGRPSAIIAHAAMEFSSVEAFIYYKGKKANAKKLLELLSLGASYPTLPSNPSRFTLNIEAIGDKEQALSALKKLIDTFEQIGDDFPKD